MKMLMNLLRTLLNKGVDETGGQNVADAVELNVDEDVPHDVDEDAADDVDRSYSGRC